MRHGVDDPILQAEGELAVARLSMDSGDLAHAARHLAGAVGWAPDHPEVRKAIADLIHAHGDDGVAYFAADGSMYLGMAVARAYALAEVGRFDEAFDLLAAATAYQPEKPWAVVDWMDDPAVPARIPAEKLTTTLMRLAPRLPEPVTDPAAIAACRPYLQFAAHALKSYPAEGLLHGIASSLARRLGEVDRAIEWARAGVQETPSGLTEMFLAMAYRAGKRVDDAAAALQRAIELDVSNLALYSDLAELLADNDQLDAAIEWVERARAVDPEYDCVVHVGQRLKFQRDGDVAHLVALADFARHHRDYACDHSDLTQACYETPWLGYVPEPTEASINALAQMRDSEAGAVSMAISDFEPPSAIAAVGRVLPGIEVTFTRIAEPDPRRPLRPSPIALWRFTGERAVPAVPPPSPTAVTAIRAVTRFRLPDPPTAYDDAVRLSALAPPDLLALLVYPPVQTNDDIDWDQYPALWPRAVQAWACLGLLHHRADQPWLTSVRRQVLVDLAFGVEDWIVEAALFALSVAAWVDPNCRADVAEVVRDRLAAASEAMHGRPVTIAGSLARIGLNTPDLGPDGRDLARRIQAEAG